MSDEQKKNQILLKRAQMRKNICLDIFGAQPKQINIESSLSTSSKLLKQHKSNMSNSKISLEQSVSLSNSIKKKEERDQKKFLKYNSIEGSQLRKKCQFYDRYIDLQEMPLGEGTTGIVKKYKHKKNGTIYAVKTIRTNDEEILIQAKNCFKLQKKLKHPFICQTQELYIDEEKEHIFEVMELSENYINLTEYLCQFPNKRVPTSIVKKIIRSLLTAVIYLHEMGVCHRDLKPDNIMVNRDDPSLIKIIDFGIAKDYILRDPGNKYNVILIKLWTRTGTLAYKAPEMFNSAQYTQSVDVWSVGIITYELVYGELPFFSEYQFDTISLIQSANLHFPENLQTPEEDKLFKNFISRLIKKDDQNNKRIMAEDSLNDPWLAEKLSEREGNQARKVKDDYTTNQIKKDIVTQNAGKFIGESTPASLIANKLISIPNQQIAALGQNGTGIHITKKETKKFKPFEFKLKNPPRQHLDNIKEQATTNEINTPVYNIKTDLLGKIGMVNSDYNSIDKIKGVEQNQLGENENESKQYMNEICLIEREDQFKLDGYSELQKRTGDTFINNMAEDAEFNSQLDKISIQKHNSITNAMQYPILNTFSDQDMQFKRSCNNSQSSISESSSEDQEEINDPITNQIKPDFSMPNVNSLYSFHDLPNKVEESDNKQQDKKKIPQSTSSQNQPQEGIYSLQQQEDFKEQKESETSFGKTSLELCLSQQSSSQQSKNAFSTNENNNSQDSKQNISDQKKVKNAAEMSNSCQYMDLTGELQNTKQRTNRNSCNNNNNNNKGKTQKKNKCRINLIDNKQIRSSPKILSPKMDNLINQQNQQKDNCIDVQFNFDSQNQQLNIQNEKNNIEIMYQKLHEGIKMDVPDYHTEQNNQSNQDDQDKYKNNDDNNDVSNRQFGEYYLEFLGKKTQSQGLDTIDDRKSSLNNKVDDIIESIKNSNNCLDEKQNGNEKDEDEQINQNFRLNMDMYD